MPGISSSGSASSIKLQDESGVAYGVKQINGKPRVSSMPYLYDIAEGNVPGHKAFFKSGYNPAVGVTEEEVWSAGGPYVFPTAAMGMELLSSSATVDADIGTVLFTGTADAGGTTTTLLDAGVDFTATAVAGDILIVEKSGTQPEYAVLTAVANGSVTFSGGLSAGGSCVTARTYQILDASAATGAMAVELRYLDTAFAEHEEIVLLNTSTVVPTVNDDIYRINYMEVIAVGTKAGATYAPAGNITLRHLADTPIYAHITLGFNRARQAIYTVPAGNSLYITHITLGAATPNDVKVQTCRFILESNSNQEHDFKGAGNIFYPYAELLVTNTTETLNLEIPEHFPEGSDIKVAAIGFTAFAGPVTTVLRGWYES